MCYVLPEMFHVKAEKVLSPQSLLLPLHGEKNT